MFPPVKQGVTYGRSHQLTVDDAVDASPTMTRSSSAASSGLPAQWPYPISRSPSGLASSNPCTELSSATTVDATPALASADLAATRNMSNAAVSAGREGSISTTRPPQSILRESMGSTQSAPTKPDTTSRSVQEAQETAIRDPFIGQHCFDRGSKRPFKRFHRTTVALRQRKDPKEALESRDASSYAIHPSATAAGRDTSGSSSHLAVYFPGLPKVDTAHDPKQPKCLGLCNGTPHPLRGPVCRFCKNRISKLRNVDDVFNQDRAMEHLQHDCRGIPAEDRSLWLDAFCVADHREMAKTQTQPFDPALQELFSSSVNSGSATAAPAKSIPAKRNPLPQPQSSRPANNKGSQSASVSTSTYKSNTPAPRAEQVMRETSSAQPDPRQVVQTQPDEMSFEAVDSSRDYSMHMTSLEEEIDELDSVSDEAEVVTSAPADRPAKPAPVITQEGDFRFEHVSGPATIASLPAPAPTPNQALLTQSSIVSSSSSSMPLTQSTSIPTSHESQYSTPQSFALPRVPKQLRTTKPVALQPRPIPYSGPIADVHAVPGQQSKFLWPEQPGAPVPYVSIEEIARSVAAAKQAAASADVQPGVAPPPPTSAQSELPGPPLIAPATTAMPATSTSEPAHRDDMRVTAVPVQVSSTGSVGSTGSSAVSAPLAPVPTLEASSSEVDMAQPAALPAKAGKTEIPMGTTVDSTTSDEEGEIHEISTSPTHSSLVDAVLSLIDGSDGQVQTIPRDAIPFVDSASARRQSPAPSVSSKVKTQATKPSKSQTKQSSPMSTGRLANDSIHRRPANKRPPSLRSNKTPSIISISGSEDSDSDVDDFVKSRRTVKPSSPVVRPFLSQRRSASPANLTKATRNMPSIGIKPLSKQAPSRDVSDHDDDSMSGSGSDSTLCADPRSDDDSDDSDVVVVASKAKQPQAPQAKPPAKSRAQTSNNRKWGPAKVQERRHTSPTPPKEPKKRIIAASRKVETASKAYDDMSEDSDQDARPKTAATTVGPKKGVQSDSSKGSYTAVRQASLSARGAHTVPDSSMKASPRPPTKIEREYLEATADPASSSFKRFNVDGTVSSPIVAEKSKSAQNKRKRKTRATSDDEPKKGRLIRAGDLRPDSREMKSKSHHYHKSEGFSKKSKKPRAEVSSNETARETLKAAKSSLPKSKPLFAPETDTSGEMQPDLLFRLAEAVERYEAFPLELERFRGVLEEAGVKSMVDLRRDVKPHEAKEFAKAIAESTKLPDVNTISKLFAFQRAITTALEA